MTLTLLCQHRNRWELALRPHMINGHKWKAAADYECGRTRKLGGTPEIILANEQRKIL
jgi:hypothetical protein